ncbi:hypothetical protein [Gemmatimonas sp.]|uniref:hypothetical protein n=1 Tax=Gemmatimonas sp. TaxID=1962908 RepID=UPI0025C16FB4|nr:hypothetical protein [Gemmatimonas sp.]MCA2995601.1 hypothetical protein [Gemmatimonas sp.]
MLIQAIGGVVMSLGLILTSTGAPVLIAGRGNDECLRQTQYDFANDSIRECLPIVHCDDPANRCERRSDTYREDGLTVTVVFCSCEVFDVNADPTGICHIYRHHKGSITFPRCTNGTDCAEWEYCTKRYVSPVWPPIQYCSCFGTRPRGN